MVGCRLATYRLNMGKYTLFLTPVVCNLVKLGRAMRLGGALHRYRTPPARRGSHSSSRRGKHQIRCHLAHVGHSLVTDGRYAPQELSQDLKWCPRNFLHRGRLRLLTPSQQVVEVCDALPKDLRQVLGGLAPVDPACEGLLSALVAGEVGPMSSSSSFHSRPGATSLRRLAQSGKGIHFMP